MRPHATLRVTAVLAIAVLSGLVTVACGPDRRPAPTPPPAPLHLTPPLADVAVGEQVRLRRMHEEWIYTVVAVGDHTVQVERRKTLDGEAMGEPEVYTWDRKGFGVPEDCVILRLERTSLDVDDVARPCWLLYIQTSEGRFYYWVTDEVGVHGLLAIAKELKGRPDEAHAIRWVHDSVSGWR